MTTRRIFDRQTPARGRAAAVRWAAERAADVPQSALYLQPAAVGDTTVTDEWARHGSRVRLRLERFRTLVDELYEADTYEGPSTYVTDAERRWVVSDALTRIDDPDHPLYSEGEPAAGLVDQAEELLTLLEFAGAITATEVERRLAREALDELGRTLSRFVAHVHDARADGFDEPKTFRSERFRHVLDAGRPLVRRELAATDVVVVGAFRTLSAQERDVVALLADAFDIGVVLARVGDGDVDGVPDVADKAERDTATGVDHAVRGLCEWYDRLGCTPSPSADDRGSVSPRETAAAALYRQDGGSGDPVALGDGVSVETHATVQREVRAITRTVRSLIGDGVEPEAIAIAPFDEATYGDRLADALRDADVPVAHGSDRSFFATTTGTLFEATIDLGSEPDRLAPLVRLLSNPLVFPSRTATTRKVIRIAERSESTRTATLMANLDGNAETLVREVVAACKRFVTTTDVDAARRRLFDDIGVPTTADGTGLTDAVGFSRGVGSRERRAIEHATEVCAALAERREVAGGSDDRGMDVESVRRALDGITVRVSTGRTSDAVRVCSPWEAAANSAEHVFVPGSTTEHTPSPPRRLAFARPLNDAHPDFEAADPVAATRYAFAQLVASDAAVTFSAPERDPDGDPYVPADPIVELERVTDVDATSVGGERAEPATVTDVHRSLARAIDTGALTPETVSTDAETYDIAVSEANAPSRLANGVRVSAARASDEVGKYDGHVDPAVVADLRDGGRPYSPSRLETFADCAFRYYLEHVLEIEPDDPLTLEPNALDVGSYVHDVLERFYREWRADGHETITGETLAAAEERLYAVAVERLETLRAPDTAFHDAWLDALFDGLRGADAVADDPEPTPGDPDAPAGLFNRFLEAETALASRDATPTYFEAHVGLTPDDPGLEPLAADPVRVPGTDVALRGKIDRLDVTADGGIVGIDYKTGGTPSERDTIDGHAFQLPAYLLLAEAALDAEPVGAAYYQVRPAGRVSPYRGTIGGDEDAAHARWGRDDPEPLRRYRSLAFDTRAAFTEFLHDTVPDRIDRIATAVDAGSFHPTVLDPGDAGCSYCPYRGACDVRHHRRHDIHQHLHETDVPRYAPGVDTEGGR